MLSTLEAGTIGEADFDQAEVERPDRLADGSVRAGLGARHVRR